MPRRPSCVPTPVRGPAATEPLILNELPLVHALAREQRLPRGVALERADLVQCGALGLVEAARRHDAARPNRFQTFARWRVLGAMVDAVRREAPLPRTLARWRARVEAAAQLLRQEYAGEPAEDELAAALGLGLPEFQRLRARLDQAVPLHLDQPSGGGQPLPLLAREEQRPDRLCAAAVVQDRLATALAALPTSFATVLRLRYEDGLSVAAIAQRLNRPYHRIHACHHQALARLRALLARQGITSAGS